MTKTVLPGARTGTVRICSSKSQAHRLLICAAMGSRPVRLRLDGMSDDIAATADCLRAMGAEITHENENFLKIFPTHAPHGCDISLYCRESGSTLRFLLPMIGALGMRAVFHMEGRLPQRPLQPLEDTLSRGGMTLRREGNLLFCAGQLREGAYSIPGNISSQYISGLLMALPLLEGDSTLTVTGQRESEGYIAMTEQVLSLGGVRLEKTDTGYRIPGGQRYVLPEVIRAEGDYSNAAFFLVMGALSPTGIRVEGLSPDSVHGDRQILPLLKEMGAVVIREGDAVTVRKGRLRGISVDCRNIPDLVPALAVCAACGEGTTVFTGAGRLRQKESDRIASTVGLIRALGGIAAETKDGLTVTGAPLTGGTVNSCGDHRIAMAAAAAAGACREPVSVSGSECVSKSYPAFWEVLDSLKGAEQ